jgi:two-component system, LytTR family, sensor kinase
MKFFINWYFKFFPIENNSKFRRILTHFIFWVIFAFFLSFASISKISWFHVLILSYLGTIQSVLFFYGVFYIFIPKISSRKTFYLGILSLVLVSVIYSGCSYILYRNALNYNLFTTKSYIYNYAIHYTENGFLGLFYSNNLLFEGNTIMSSLAIPLLIKFSRLVEKSSRRIEKISREKIEIELNFLKSQINPHFLLNSINNIYSQVVSKDKNAANTIITLSNLLKYILYHSHEEYLDLAQEINFIRDFIDLEKLRNGKRLNIRFTQEGNFKGFKIAPFILINYIENAFKHGITRDGGETSVIIVDIKLENGILNFLIENTIYYNNSSIHKKERGIGLINTQKRLMNLYDQKYLLLVSKENEKFCVKLTLNLT